jgi:hypothetical protein
MLRVRLESATMKNEFFSIDLLGIFCLQFYLLTMVNKSNNATNHRCR